MMDGIHGVGLVATKDLNLNAVEFAYTLFRRAEIINHQLDFLNKDECKMTIENTMICDTILNGKH